MDRIGLAIIISFVVTLVVWLVCDVMQIIVTPLSFLGMTHWIPEFYVIFFFGYDSAFKIKPKLIDTIAIGIFLYPLLYYIIMGSSIIEYMFGFGAGCLFSCIFLIGVWGREKNAGKEPRYSFL